MNLPDIQNTPPNERLSIDKVGIKNLKYPIKVLDKTKGFQFTIAELNIYVDLPSEFKGTHMSRFVEVLNEFKDEIHIKNINNILNRLKERLNAKSAHIEIYFPYFIQKKAPVSGISGLMEYQVFLKASLLNSKKDLILGVKVPIMTLCPCSKSISKYGAHNQRGIASVSIRFKNFIWIEDLIEIIEASASSPLYPILKRPDEKFVTEKAYENPKFVEDVAREIASKLLNNPNILWAYIEVENFESIHWHNAYASIEIKNYCSSPSSSSSISTSK